MERKRAAPWAIYVLLLVGLLPVAPPAVAVSPAGLPINAPTPPAIAYPPDEGSCPRSLPGAGGGGRDVLANAGSAAGSAVTLKIPGRSRPFTATEFSSNGEQLLTSDGEIVTLLDSRTGNVLKRFARDGARLSAPVLSESGRMIAMLENSERVLVFDLPSGRQRFETQLPEPDFQGSRSGTLALSPDGSTIAASSGRQILLLDATTGRELGRLSGTRVDSWTIAHGHSHAIPGLSFGPDGRVLLSASLDGTLRLWDTANGRHLRCFEVLDLGGKLAYPEFESAAFGSDGRAVAGASNLGVYLWDAVTGKTLGTIRPQQRRGYHDADFSGDGRLLATGGYDKATRVWNVATTELVGLMRHPGEVYSVAFHPAGELIVSGFGGSAEVLAPTPAPGTNGAWVWSIRHQSVAVAVQADKLVTAGIAAAKRGNISGTRRLYGQAERVNPFRDYPVIHAEAWSLLCWYGSLYGQVRQVLDACERGVQLDPNDGSVRDSRGLARALTGNFEGAVEDFEAYVDWSYFRPSNRELYEKLRAKRLAWIAALKAGRNPFDAVTLQALKSE